MGLKTVQTPQSPSNQARHQRCSAPDETALPVRNEPSLIPFHHPLPETTPDTHKPPAPRASRNPPLKQPRPPPKPKWRGPSKGHESAQSPRCQRRSKSSGQPFCRSAGCRHHALMLTVSNQKSTRPMDGSNYPSRPCVDYPNGNKPVQHPTGVMRCHLPDDYVPRLRRSCLFQSKLVRRDVTTRRYLRALRTNRVTLDNPMFKSPLKVSNKHVRRFFYKVRPPLKPRHIDAGVLRFSD